MPSGSGAESSSGPRTSTEPSALAPARSRNPDDFNVHQAGSVRPGASPQSVYAGTRRCGGAPGIERRIVAKTSRSTRVRRWARCRTLPPGLACGQSRPVCVHGRPEASGHPPRGLTSTGPRATSTAIRRALPGFRRGARHPGRSRFLRTLASAYAWVECRNEHGNSTMTGLGTAGLVTLSLILSWVALCSVPLWLLQGYFIALFTAAPSGPAFFQYAERLYLSYPEVLAVGCVGGWVCRRILRRNSPKHGVLLSLGSLLPALPLMHVALIALSIVWIVVLL